MPAYPGYPAISIPIRWEGLAATAREKARQPNCPARIDPFACSAIRSGAEVCAFAPLVALQTSCYAAILQVGNQQRETESKHRKAEDAVWIEHGESVDSREAAPYRVSSSEQEDPGHKMCTPHWLEAAHLQ
jgi:hypothetical protein